MSWIVRSSQWRQERFRQYLAPTKPVSILLLASGTPLRVLQWLEGLGILDLPSDPAIGRCLVRVTAPPEAKPPERHVGVLDSLYESSKLTSKIWIRA